ncbi:MAG: hypothetical protein KatS3mg071_1566 [Meiothermus sp.]|jgi:hypothetical protein|nr:MAG: hypothetical protein KatS3mg071_1566 [Meiothermus sp.]
MEQYRGIEPMVASHRYTSGRVLEILSWHPQAEVRRLVARHPNTDEATRQRLQQDVCPRVRLASQR